MTPAAPVANDPTVLILTSLSSGPKHGYALTQDIEDFAGVRLGPGTLYGAITRLERRGLIEPLEAEERRRPYRITSPGEETLATALASLRRVLDTGSQRLARGPHPGEPTPQEVREEGTKFCVGTPADCIRFLELYEALGIEEAILLCAVGPAQHEEVLHTLRLFGERVIPHFQAKESRSAFARAAC